MATTPHHVVIPADAGTRRRERGRGVGLMPAFVMLFVLASVIAAALFVGLRPSTQVDAEPTGAQRVFVIGSSDPARLKALDHALESRAGTGKEGFVAQRIYLIGSNDPARMKALAHAG